MTLEELEQGSAAGRLVCERAARYLHGCVRLEREPQGWAHPCRFTELQERMLGSCQAWHPGLYRQMARCTAGVTLEFDTDASELALELWIDGMAAGTRTVLGEVERWRELQDPSLPAVPSDALALEVDDRVEAVPLPSQGPGVLSLTLDDPQARPRPDLLQLPLLAGDRRVRLWLPSLHACSLRRIWCNGSHLTPVATRPSLLVLGDSLAQGFVVGEPSASWPARLARQLGCDLLNQGVGGQVFQPGMVLSPPELGEVHALVVALGTNYRHEPCSERLVASELRLFLENVAHRWPDVPTWVITPPWHDELASPSHAGSCWQGLPDLIEREVATHDDMRLVDGMRLLDADPALMADGSEHPNAAGAAQMAERLQVLMHSPAGISPEALRERALEVLKDAPRTTFALHEAIRRGCAEVLLAEAGCVMARVRAAELMLWASDARLARAALAVLADENEVVCDLHAPQLADELADRLGLTRVEPYHLAVYEVADPLPRDEEHLIHVLDESYLPQVMEHYAHAEWLDEREVVSLLARGRFLGGFEGDELVGFIGEHAVGAIGLLEVFPGHRRRGWAAALEACQINRTLERGDVPWTQVYPHNRASLRVQRSLGLTLIPASEQCYVSRGTG